MEILISIIVIVILIVSFSKRQNENKNKEANKVENKSENIISENTNINLDKYTNLNYKYKNYKIKNVFTKSEGDFYIKLKEYLKEKNVILLSKVRLADFVGFKEKLYGYEFGKNFGAIAQKHIDFIITDYNGRILALIELDGYSHNYDKTKNNDIFKNELFESLKIPLIRYKSNFHYDFSNLEKIIA